MKRLITSRSSYPGYDHISWTVEFNIPKTLRYLSVSFHIKHRRIWGLRFEVNLMRYLDVKGLLRHMGVEPTPENIEVQEAHLQTGLEEHAREMAELRARLDDKGPSEPLRRRIDLAEIWNRAALAMLREPNREEK